jgi:hypothetical protein
MISCIVHFQMYFKMFCRPHCQFWKIFQLKSPPSEFRINWSRSPHSLVVSALSDGAYATCSISFWNLSTCSFIQISNHFLNLEGIHMRILVSLICPTVRRFVFENVFSDIVIAYFLPIPETH